MNAAGETRLYEILHKKFEKTIFVIEPIVDITMADVKALTSTAGPRPTLFNNPSFKEPFERKVKKEVKR